MKYERRRLALSSTVSPEAYEILDNLSKDLDLPTSRALDLIINEWHEMSQQNINIKLTEVKRMEALAQQMKSLEDAIRRVQVKAA